MSSSLKELKHCLRDESELLKTLSGSAVKMPALYGYNYGIKMRFSFLYELLLISVSPLCRLSARPVCLCDMSAINLLYLPAEVPLLLSKAPQRVCTQPGRD